MAILKFSKGDKLASAVMPSAWYSAKVAGMKDPELSGSKKSYNIYTKFAILNDEKYAGKELEISFNTGMKSPSIMGTLVLIPSNQIPYLAAACEGKIFEGNVDDLPDEVETAQMLEKELDIRVEKTIHEGIIMNVITGFLPLGKGIEKDKEGPAF